MTPQSEFRSDQGSTSDVSASWMVAIFSARESADVLLACIEAVLAACAGRSSTVDVLVNGNDTLAMEIGGDALMQLARPPGCRLRLWSLALGDKASTWNDYVNQIWSGTGTVFFVDGYVRVRADALQSLQQALDGSVRALAATGVPTMGRSSESLRQQMLHEGGMHGNLYAIRGEVVQELRRRKIRLPVGLYRTDAVLGAILAFGLDPARHDWDSARIHVEPKATWEYRRLDWWRPTHLLAQFKRMVRQAQGSLENGAIRQYLAEEKGPPEQIPSTVGGLILPWLEAQPMQARQIMRARPLSRLAVRRLRTARTVAVDRYSVRLVRELSAADPMSPAVRPTGVSTQ